MRMFSKKPGKQFVGVCVLLLTAMYLFATGAYAQEANLNAGTTKIQYDQAHISYGDIWSFNEESHNASAYASHGEDQGFSWYNNAGTDVTTEPDKVSYPETYFEKAVITDKGNFDEANSLPMKKVPYASLVSNVSTGSVAAPVGNGVEIPVITASESGGAYSVVPGKTGKYYIHAYVADATEATLELDYALLDSAGDTNAFAENGFGEESVTLNRIGESGWYRGEITVSTVSWYACNISVNATSSSENKGNSGIGIYSGGVETDLSLTGGTTLYYYNNWSSTNIYYDTILAIQIPAGVTLGPIGSEGKLTIANNTEKGSLTATSIFGEALAVNEELTIPNMPILLNVQSNGYYVVGKFTSGGQTVLPVEGGVPVANRLHTIVDAQTFVYYHEGNADARDLTMNWSDPVALPMISVTGVTQGAGNFNFINKVEGSGQTTRGTNQSVVFTLDFAAAEDVASVVYTVNGDSINGVSSYNGELTASQNVLTVETMFDVTVVEITATDTDGATHVFKYTVNPVGGDAVAKNISTGKTYAYVEDALVEAASGQRIMLLEDASFIDSTLTEGHLSRLWVADNAGYTVKSGVTLQIPFDDAGTLITTNMKDNVIPYKEFPASDPYRKLTVPAGINLNVASGGSLNVGSKAHAQMIGQIGPYGLIELGADAKITVNGGGVLYAWGYIWGEGSVDVLNGGKVYQALSVKDYTNDAGVCLTVFSGNTTPVSGVSDVGTLLEKAKGGNAFPLRAYTISNIEVPLTINYGAEMYGFYHLYGESAGAHGDNILLIGTSDSCMFQMMDESASIVLRYKNGRQSAKFNGNIHFNALNVSVSFIMTINISTASTSGVPIPGCWDMEVASGTLTLGDNCILTEGGTVTIAEGAVLDINGKNIYMLNAADDPGAAASADVHGAANSPTDFNGYLDINGTLRASGGFYTSNGKFDIKSSNGTGVVEYTGNRNVYTTKTFTYADAGTVPVKEGVNTWKNIPIIPAELKNADGSYVQIAEAANTYNYNAETERWECAAHTPGTEADCDNAQTCTVCGAVVTPALGHSWGDAAYNFAADGSSCTATRTCSNDASHVETATAAEINSAEKTPATVDEMGWTTYTATFIEDWAETRTLDVQDIPALTAVAEYNDTKYATLTEAVAAANGGKVYLLTNITEETAINQAAAIYKKPENEAFTANIKAGDGFVLTERDDAYIIAADVETVTYSATSLSVEGKLVLMLKFKVPSDILADETATVTWIEEANLIEPEKTTVWTMEQLKASRIDDKGRYVIQQDIASGEMANNVTVIFASDASELTIYDEKTGAPYTDGFVRSALDFSRDALAKGNPKMQYLSQTMLTYGSYAQQYYTTYEDAAEKILPTELLSEQLDLEAMAQYWNPDDTTYSFTYGGAELGIPLVRPDDSTKAGVTQSLILKSDTTIRTYFFLDDGVDINSLTFTLTYPVNRVERTMTLTPVESTNGRYYVDIENIPVAYWDYQYKITVTSNAAEGEFVISSSVLAWAKRCIAGSDKPLQVTMAKAMFLYNKAATEYYGK